MYIGLPTHIKMELLPIKKELRKRRGQLLRCQVVIVKTERSRRL
jgi:hypothetical protein